MVPLVDLCDAEKVQVRDMDAVAYFCLEKPLLWAALTSGWHHLRWVIPQQHESTTVAVYAPLIYAEIFLLNSLQLNTRFALQVMKSHGDHFPLCGSEFCEECLRIPISSSPHPPVTYTLPVVLGAYEADTASDCSE